MTGSANMSTKMTPDFNRLLTAIQFQEPDRLPLAELWVDPPVKSAFLSGVPEEILDCRKEGYDVEKDIEFWNMAGYDFIRITPRYEFPKSWLNHPEARLSTLKEYEAYPWPAQDRFDYSDIEKAAILLPEGMKIMASPQGGIFEEAWMTMGYENLMMALYENPELVQKVCDSIGATLLEMFKCFSRYDHVGGFWLSDDIAYTEGLILSPEMIRHYFFPWYEQYVAIAKESGKVFFFHSDGDLTPLLDDFIAMGFDAIHPIEPKAMDIIELKKRVGGRLALLGSVDLDFPLSRGKPEDVVQYIKKRIKAVAPGGGFAIGSSNSVTHYVPLENFQAMLDTVKEYGIYPIGI